MSTSPSGSTLSDSPAQPRSVAAASPGLRLGIWVEITEGAAAGTRGWVCRCAAGEATLVAVGVTRLPLLLTVPAERCRPLRR